MAGVSQVVVIGNLGRDPETRFTPSGSMNVSFSVAASRRWTDSNGQQQENTTWFRITAWGNLADTVNKLTEQGYLAKGKQVYVQGRLEAREWTDRNGVNRTSLEVTANEIQLLGSRPDDSGGGFGAESRAPVGRTQDSDESFDENSIDDVPF
jgi:single-strand DNA-binding protein